MAEGSGVPAGWYPDPLGLPQLRWWDGTAWTEFASALEPEADEVATADAADASRAADEVAPGDAAEVTSVADEVAPGDAAGDVDAGPNAELDDEGGAATPVLAIEDVEPIPIEPEPVAPEPADPFAAAETNAVQFTSRRARRAFERQRELETGGPMPAAQGYSRLDTNPIDIQLASPGGSGRDASAGQRDSVPPSAGTTIVVAPSGAESSASQPREAEAGAPASSASGPSSPEPVAEPTFSLDAIEVDEELAPPRTLIPKRTSTFASQFAAMLIPLAVLAIIALRFVPGVTPSPEVAWGILAGAYLLGVLLAVIDRGALQRAGHEQTASPLLALLTPIGYLSVRAVMTRQETGHGGSVVLAWIIGLVLAVLLVVLFPDVLTLIVPGFVAPWTSVIG